jgi:hypothetical protein
MPAIKKKVKYFIPIHSSSISERTLLFGRFSRLARLSFWQGQYVDEDECGTLEK